MTTSGTADFNLEFVDMAQEAFERCGVDLRSGYDMKTARRSLNLMTVEWANRGIHLWLIEEGILPLITGQADYDLPADTIDLIEQVIRTGDSHNQIDITINRISPATYATIPNKTAKGRPIQVWIQRLRDNPKISVWPTPDGSEDYRFVYWRMRRIQDAGGGTSTQDIPFRFLNAMVAGLAYYMSMKLPVDPNRRAELKMDYEQQLQMAEDQDRVKASVRFVPWITPY